MNRIDIRTLGALLVTAAAAVGSVACGGGAEAEEGTSALERQLAVIDSAEAAVERINERSDPEAYVNSPDEVEPEPAATPRPAPRPTTVRRDAPEPDRVAPEIRPAPGIGDGEPVHAGPVIPVGAELELILDEEVSTRTHAQGDVVWARVAREVLAADGLVLVPEGTAVRATVLESMESPSSEEPAILVLDFDRILFEEGEAPIDAQVMETELKADEKDSDTETATKVAVGAAAGALLGKVLGGDTEDAVKAGAVGAAAGAAVAIGTRAGHAKLEAGSRVVIRLADPVRLVS